MLLPHYLKLRSLSWAVLPCLTSAALGADYLPLSSPEGGGRSPFLDRGRFQLFPRCSAGLAYNDNILFSEGQPVSDLIGFVAPGLTLVVGETVDPLAGGSPVAAPSFSGAYGNLAMPSRGLSMSSLGLSFDYGARASFYADNPELNAVDHAGRLNAALPLPRGRISLEQQLASTAESPVELATRTRQTLLATRLGFLHELGPLMRWDSSLDYTSNQYEEGLGNKQLSGSGSVDYLLSDLTTVGMGGVVGVLDVEDGYRQTFEQWRVSAAYSVTELISVGASGGVEWRQYDTGESDDPTPVFGLSVSYAPTERMSLALRGGRRVTSSALLQNQNYTESSLGFSWLQRLTPRLSGSLACEYKHLVYTAIDNVSPSSDGRKDDYLSATVQLDYQLAWRVSLGVFYGYRNNLTSESVGGYVNNQVGFSLNWAY